MPSKFAPYKSMLYVVRRLHICPTELSIPRPPKYTLDISLHGSGRLSLKVYPGSLPMSRQLRPGTASALDQTRWPHGNSVSAICVYTYDVEDDPQPVVMVAGVGIKGSNLVYIGGEVYPI